MIPRISLAEELEREIDRRHAAHLSRDDLAILVDRLIVDLYQRQSVLNQALGRVRQLEVELVLSGAPPNTGAIEQRYLEMAQNLAREHQPPNTSES